MKMELTNLQKEMIIIGLEKVQEQLKPAWDDFLFLKKERRIEASELYSKCENLLSIKR